MKYLYYLGGTILGALILVLAPQTVTPKAHAAEQQPRLDSWASAQFNDTNFGGAYITIQGQMWPDKPYGLSASLFDRQTLTQIPLETFSYTPLADRMVVQVPGYVKLPAATRSYDLILSTVNGTRTTAENAILVTIGQLAVTPPPSSNAPEPIVTPPPVVIPTPSTDIVKGTNGAPLITGYTQETPWSATSGGTFVIIGNNWPLMEYGLDVLLVKPDTDTQIRLTVISYTPVAGQMVVQTPSYDLGAFNGWYDLVVMTINGERTTIRNAVQYLG